jgi:hypothetical protein
MDRGIGRRLMVSRWGCRQEGDFTSLCVLRESIGQEFANALG